MPLDAQRSWPLVPTRARGSDEPHADRNKAVYGLLHTVEAWPGDAPAIDEAAGDTLRAIAEDSILFNVRDPARELITLLDE